MAAACAFSYVANWLFEVGATEDTRIVNNCAKAPLLVACAPLMVDVVNWLVGAANDESCRADSEKNTSLSG